MTFEANGAPERAREGTAVSSGDSSAVQPRPDLSPAGDPGAQADFDATLPEGVASPVPAPALKRSPPPTPKSDPSNDVTMAEIRRPRDPSSGVAQQVYASIGATIFEVGSVLGGRYEIQKLLGMGGMGAVYKARDVEVDRAVGLKVIRPDLAGNPAILARFKQELVLARQVTHRNIIRIYDLSEAEGVKFITMEFIEGEDLRTILTREGKLQPNDAINIIRQCCAGLQAAHVEGVIHRDLKPSNIMRDASGRVVIMDFGLAKTVQGDGMTQTGMMIGTMEYMSPEQAMGSDIDARSDIFAIGLIFYELITGNMPYRAESAIASLVRRTQERAVPLEDVDPTVPIPISQIVAKCLERNPKDRYSNIQELLDDLDLAQGKRPRSGAFGHSALRNTALGDVAATLESPSPAIPAPAVETLPPQSRPWKWIGVAALALILAAGSGGYYWWTHRPVASSRPVITIPATSIAVLPFYNASGDPNLNWLSSSLSESIATDIGQSAHVRLVSPNRVQQVLQDLRIPQLQQNDLGYLKRIAEYTNADIVVFGQYSKVGDQIRIDSTVNDLKQDRHFEVTTQVPDTDKDLLASLGTLSQGVREKLASTSSELKDLQAGRSRFVLTQSVPALRAYYEGLQQFRSNNYNEAVAKFEEAINDDPNFALALSELAQAYKALGREDAAQKASRQAVALADSLPAREKLLIDAQHDSVMNNTNDAIAAYESLTKATPGDIDAQFELAKLYDQEGRYNDARARLQVVREAEPKNAEALWYSGRVEIAAEKPQAGLEFLNTAYNLATLFNNDALKASIEQAQGIAYQDLNKPEEALKNFQEALTIRRKLGLQSDVAGSLDHIAQIQDQMGDAEAALAGYKEALAIRQKLGDNRRTALLQMNLGSFYNDHAQYGDALKVLNEALTTYRSLNDESSQAICLNSIGTSHFNLGNFQDALTDYQQAYTIREKLNQTASMAESQHNLAETNVKLGNYSTALAQYLKALEYGQRAGDQARVALEQSSLGDLYATQGEYGKALTSLQDSVKAFQALNDQTYIAADALGRYGNVLSLVGREEDGRKQLQDALKRAEDAKNAGIKAEILNWLGDSYFYAGDYASARQQYDRAATEAAKARNAEIQVSNFNSARLDVVQGRYAAAIPALQKLVRETDAKGLKALSVQASLYLAQALLTANKVDEAHQELDRATNNAEKLGLLIEQARGDYLMGDLLSVGGKTIQYVPRYQAALRKLEAVSQQPGAGRMLDRSDLKPIYEEAKKSYQGAA